MYACAVHLPVYPRVWRSVWVPPALKGAPRQWYRNASRGIPLGYELTKVLAYQGGAYLRTVRHANQKERRALETVATELCPSGTSLVLTVHLTLEVRYP